MFFGPTDDRLTTFREVSGFAPGARSHRVRQYVFMPTGQSGAMSTQPSNSSNRLALEFGIGVQVPTNAHGGRSTYLCEWVRKYAHKFMIVVHTLSTYLSGQY